MRDQDFGHAVSLRQLQPQGAVPQQESREAAAPPRKPQSARIQPELLQDPPLDDTVQDRRAEQLLQFFPRNFGEDALLEFMKQPRNGEEEGRPGRMKIGQKVSRPSVKSDRRARCRKPASPCPSVPRCGPAADTRTGGRRRSNPISREMGATTWLKAANRCMTPLGVPVVPEV